VRPRRGDRAYVSAVEIRKGSGCLGVPAMIAVFAFLAFAIRGEHPLVALLAIPIVLLVIGFVVWLGKRRGED
jgi:hypothetical protein